MAKKKTKSSKKQPTDLDDNLLSAFDSALLEQGVREQDALPETPESRGQQLAFRAYSADSSAERVQLAKQALQIWPDCADAYVVLSHESDDDNERLRFCENAVAAGNRAIGERTFREHVGAFWAIPQTRPFMRALLDQSNLFWHLTRYEESIKQVREVLRLNPRDDQGARYVLMSRLLFLQQDEAAFELLNEFANDSTADWQYSKALLLFRREGNTPASVKALRAAKRSNKFVPAYLVGHEQLPDDLPEYITLGQRSEAENYCGDAMRHWRDTSGAIPWVRETLNIRRPKPDAEKSNQRTWNRRKTKLLDLPQDPDEVWHVSLATIGVNSPVDAEKPVWGLVAMSTTREQVVAGEFYDRPPSSQEAFRWLADSMLQPSDDEARRPAAVTTSARSFVKNWQSKLREIGIECKFEEAPNEVSDYLELLGRERDRQFGSGDGKLLSDDKLQYLPIGNEEWQLDVRLLPAFIGSRGTPHRPWTLLLGDATNEFVIGQDLITEPPSPEWILRIVRQAMSAPGIGPPRRPTAIRVATVEQHEILAAWLKGIDVSCLISEKLEFLDFLFADVTRHLAGEHCPPGLLSVTGVEPEQGAGIFDAAADFYRAMPWRSCSPDTTIKIESPTFQSGPWFAVVMGQRGLLQGIALYEEPELVEAELSSEPDAIRQHSGLAVYFGEAFDIPASDLHDLERFGWQVAGEEAYPTILRVNPGMNIRRPFSWELRLLEASLRAVQNFVTRPPTEPKHYEIPTTTGPVTLTLAWAR